MWRRKQFHNKLSQVTYWNPGLGCGLELCCQPMSPVCVCLLFCLAMRQVHIIYMDDLNLALQLCVQRIIMSLPQRHNYQTVSQCLNEDYNGFPKFPCGAVSEETESGTAFQATLKWPMFDSFPNYQTLLNFSNLLDRLVVLHYLLYNPALMVCGQL